MDLVLEHTLHLVVIIIIKTTAIGMFTYCGLKILTTKFMSFLTLLFCYRDCLVIVIINSCTSFLAGFVTFSVIGFMAQAQNKTVSDVAISGIEKQTRSYIKKTDHTWYFYLNMFCQMVGLSTCICMFKVCVISNKWAHMIFKV